MFRFLFKKRNKITKSDYQAFLANLNESGIKFVGAEEFVDVCLNHHAAGISLLKHDVHQDLDACLTVADIEARLGIKSVFFFLGKHSLADYYGSGYFWESVRSIKNLGHEIGLHADLHELIAESGCALSGIRKIQDDFLANAGITFNSGNLHGNTAARKLNGSPKALLKAKSSDREALTHKFPQIGEKYKSYRGYYALDSFSEELGLHYWLDPKIYFKGQNVPVPVFVSDNARTIRLSKKPSTTIEIPFCRVGKKPGREFVEELKRNASQFLIHPQNIC
jgi:hypothetical protein